MSRLLLLTHVLQDSASLSLGKSTASSRISSARRQKKVRLVSGKDGVRYSDGLVLGLTNWTIYSLQPGKLYIKLRKSHIFDNYESTHVVMIFVLQFTRLFCQVLRV